MLNNSSIFMFFIICDIDYIIIHATMSYAYITTLTAIDLIYTALAGCDKGGNSFGEETFNFNPHSPRRL